MRIHTLLVVALVGISEQLSAQQRPEPLLRPGIRVRYSVPRSSHSFRGVVEEVDTLRMIVRAEQSDLRIQLGLDSLRSLAVFGGVRSTRDGAWRGARAGLALGLVLGAVATTAVWLSHADENCDDCFISATGATVGLSVVGTVGFFLAGTALGASAPGELWTEVPLPIVGRRRP